MAFLLNICALVSISKILQPGKCQIIHQAMFRKHEQKYLANHVIDKKHADTESECFMNCVGYRSCASVNFKTSGSGKGLCELNSKTLRDTSYADGSMYNPEFTHFYKVTKVKKYEYIEYPKRYDMRVYIPGYTDRLSH